MNSHALKAPALLCISAIVSTSAIAQETFSFTDVLSDGVFGSPANFIDTKSAAGGYQIGRIDLSGRLTSLHPNSWLSDSRIRITAPSGEFVDVKPFERGGPFVTEVLAKTVLFEFGNDPIGDWTFQFYESFDDGTPGQPDASWILDVELKLESIQPPPATDLGVVAFPSTTVFSHSLPLLENEIIWVRFTLDREITTTAGTFLDIDTEGSFRISAGSGAQLSADTEIALYDSAGNRIAKDDDSATHLLSQLTFGTGTRPAPNNGMPYDGRDGTLSAGVYYLAAGAHPTSFAQQGWNAVSTGPEIEHIDLNLRAGPESACYADCDPSTGVGVLDIFDFLCFQNSFVSGATYACDCDISTGLLECDIFDFLCFQNAFVAGCP